VSRENDVIFADPVFVMVWLVQIITNGKATVILHLWSVPVVSISDLYQLMSTFLIGTSWCQYFWSVPVDVNISGLYQLMSTSLVCTSWCQHLWSVPVDVNISDLYQLMSTSLICTSWCQHFWSVPVDVNILSINAVAVLYAVVCSKFTSCLQNTHRCTDSSVFIIHFFGVIS
jgi:hypothetical protein